MALEKNRGHHALLALPTDICLTTLGGSTPQGGLVRNRTANSNAETHCLNADTH